MEKISIGSHWKKKIYTKYIYSKTYNFSQGYDGSKYSLALLPDQGCIVIGLKGNHVYIISWKDNISTDSTRYIHNDNFIVANKTEEVQHQKIEVIDIIKFLEDFDLCIYLVLSVEILSFHEII